MKQPEYTCIMRPIKKQKLRSKQWTITKTIRWIENFSTPPKKK